MLLSQKVGIRVHNPPLYVHLETKIDFRCGDTASNSPVLRIAFPKHYSDMIRRNIELRQVSGDCLIQGFFRVRRAAREKVNAYQT